MCIATVQTDNVEQNETVMCDVISIESENGELLLTTILGEKKRLNARIRHLDFLKHTVTIEYS